MNVDARGSFTELLKTANSYKPINTAYREPCPLPALAIAEVTSTATKTGAIPFRAPTNITPRIPMPVQEGTKRPRLAPMTRPMKIRNIKLTCVYRSIMRRKGFITGIKQPCS